MGRSSDRNYRMWRAKVIRRDKLCVICGSNYRRAAHHVYDWSHYEKLRYDLDNGVCLCGRCHVHYHTKFNASYRTRCYRKQYERFVKLVKYARGLGNGK